MTEMIKNEKSQNIVERRNYGDFIQEFLIAIDHGWSSVKTPNLIFENGITELQTMPATKDNLLEFRGRKFVIGQGRMGKQESKTENENYYLLTLAAIAKELRMRTKVTAVKVNLAVGVPLTLYGKEKKAFRNYLLANDKVSFYYEGIDENLIVAESTRINEGVTRPQVVLYIAIPFEYSKQERKIYQEVQKKLEGESFSYTTKLMVFR